MIDDKQQEPCFAFYSSRFTVLHHAQSMRVIYCTL